MKIGTNIKKLRTARELTQDQLAEKLHVTRQTVSSWERSASNPNLEQLEAIATALEVDVMVLLYGPQPAYRPSLRRVVLTLALTAAVVVVTGLYLKKGLPWLEHQGLREFGWYYLRMLAAVPALGVCWGAILTALGALVRRVAPAPKQRRWWVLGGLVLLLVNPLLFGLGRLSWDVLVFWVGSHGAVGLVTGLVAGVCFFVAGQETRTSFFAD